MSDGSTSTKRSFNIGKEKDLIALLREVRHSTLKPEEKDNIRDAVFAMSSKANDILLRGLQDILSKINIEVTHQFSSDTIDTPTDSVSDTKKSDSSSPAEAVENSLERAPIKRKHSIGRTRRPVVSFDSNPMRPAVSVDDSTDVAVAIDKKEELIDTAPLEEKSNLSPTPTTPAVAVAEETPQAPTQSPAAPATVPAAASAMSSEAALSRIKVIKQKVNSVVGNPVNLISKNEVVGKEYMATLLEAMRVATADGDVASVMGKLEAVYEKVQTVLAAPVASEQETTVSVPETVVESVTKESLPIATPEVVEEVVSTNEINIPTPESTPLQQSVHEGSLAAPLQSTVAVPVVPESSPVLADDSVEAVLAAADDALAGATGGETKSVVVAEASDPITPAPKPEEPAHLAPIPAKSSDFDIQTNTANARADSTAVPLKKIMSPEPVAASHFQSVTAEPSAIEKQRQVMEQYKQQQKTFEAENPLRTPAVEEGLGILLGEWSIFRKSGLLGTGPKAKEHPLYKAIKDLKMNLIISGRFEGATPEVRQSIIDYMNGWRYERGIVHEMDETFETYLRRVIATILKKQNEPS